MSIAPICSAEADYPLASQADGEDRADIRNAGDLIEQAPVTPRGHLIEAGLSEAATNLLKVMSTQDG